MSPPTSILRSQEPFCTAGHSMALLISEDANSTLEKVMLVEPLSHICGFRLEEFRFDLKLQKFHLKELGRSKCEGLKWSLEGLLCPSKLMLLGQDAYCEPYHWGLPHHLICIGGKVAPVGRAVIVFASSESWGGTSWGCAILGCGFLCEHLIRNMPSGWKCVSVNWCREDV